MSAARQLLLTDGVHPDQQRKCDQKELTPGLWQWRKMSSWATGPADFCPRCSKRRAGKAVTGGSRGQRSSLATGRKVENFIMAPVNSFCFLETMRNVLNVL